MTQDVQETLVGETLVVDMVRCDGHGICAWLFPDRVGLDDWGYAWVDPEPVAPSRRRAAQAAVRACPRLALILH
jgi:ferredoxin